MKGSQQLDGVWFAHGLVLGKNYPGPSYRITETSSNSAQTIGVCLGLRMDVGLAGRRRNRVLLVQYARGPSAHLFEYTAIESPLKV